ncbi:MAG: hypothetical protein P4L57_14200 [Rhizomicrobium sp.]|nr:hypothetical protein [Rhizomicrobium sp.]
MKTILGAVAGAVLALLPAQAATTIDDPVSFVRSVYHKLATVKDYSDPDDIYTTHLAGLFALDKKDAGGEVGRLDFDFWANGQDWTLKGVTVTGHLAAGTKDREIVVAKFDNGDAPQRIEFYFEKGKNGWKLDDARSTGKDDWTLSLILKYGWVDDK